MRRTVLVVGGTGKVGRPVARRLAAEGARVRVLTRRPAKAGRDLAECCEVLAGDVEDEVALERALEGCTGLHLSLGSPDPDLERRGALAATRAAVSQGVGRITLLSGATVAPDACWYPGAKAKWEAEEVVRASGLAHAVFRASFFMESLPGWVRGRRASVIGDQPLRWHWVAAEDFAGLVVRAHADHGPSGTFPVLGPEALTIREALEVYCAARAPGVTVGTLPFWAARLLATLPGGSELRSVLPFFRYTAVRGEAVGPREARNPFGEARTTLSEWCRREATARGV